MVVIAEQSFSFLEAVFSVICCCNQRCDYAYQEDSELNKGKQASNKVL